MEDKKGRYATKMMIVKCSTKAKNRTHNSNKKHIHTKKKQIENVFKAQPIDK